MGKEVVNKLLQIEHHNTAIRLRLLLGETKEINEDLLRESITELDELSIRCQEENKKTIVTICAILWTYRKREWEFLKTFLIKILSRAGFAPSTIILDDNYLEGNRYSGVESFLDQLAISIHQYRFQISVSQREYMLTEFQHRIWHSISEHKIIGISAPTSAGKSFIIALKTVALLQEKEGIVVYIVPTLSLVNQVTLDYRKLLNEHEVSGYEILNTFVGNDVTSNVKKIYVLTQEKAIAAFTHTKNPYLNLRLIVIDEIQNVERVANEEDQRAKTLYDLIIEVKQNCKPDHIIISGPRIEKIGLLGYNLFGKDAHEDEATSSPVCSLTYSLLNKGKKSFLKQYSILSDEPAILEIPADLSMPSGVYYSDKIHDYIYRLIENLGPHSKNIVFSPKSAQAVDTAKYISSKVQNHLRSEMIVSLSMYLKSTVHENYDLAATILSGVAYHHGKLPHHVRRTIERAINDKLIPNVVCTTTLMQGVNLPAQNVIIRNPNLFIKKNKNSPNQPKLTNYEIANLRGRAGRLMKDIVGRTIVLEEGNFEKKEDQNLFNDEKKQLNSGYKSTYEKHKAKIIEDLSSGHVPSLEKKDYAFITTYIRQAALRYGEDVQEKLKDVKIELSDNEKNMVLESLANLKVPKDVCIKNRYWDPFSLNEIFLKSAEFYLPSGLEEGISMSLVRLVDQLKAVVPFYWAKHFPVANSEKFQQLNSACYNAEKWLREKPLKEILSGPYYNKAENINKTIGLLQNQISYNLPMLLQPIYDIKLPKSSFLRFIELGAFHPTTRKLIEHNIPRETAIQIKNDFLSNVDVNSSNFEDEVRAGIRRNFSKMDYWTQIQVEAII